MLSVSEFLFHPQLSLCLDQLFVGTEFGKQVPFLIQEIWRQKEIGWELWSRNFLHRCCRSSDEGGRQTSRVFQV